MFDRFFRLSENHTSVRIELLAGLTTFLTMAYIIFLQPAVLSGQLFRSSLGSSFSTGMDFGAVTTATCLAAALATAIMGLYGRYPIAQAPGMGENFFFVFSAIPAAAAMIDAQVKAHLIVPGATSPWQIALGVVFWSGILFLMISIFGIREAILNAISPEHARRHRGGHRAVHHVHRLPGRQAGRARPLHAGDAQPQVCLARPAGIFLRAVVDGRAGGAARPRRNPLGDRRRHGPGRGAAADARRTSARRWPDPAW